MRDPKTRTPVVPSFPHDPQLDLWLGMRGYETCPSSKQPKHHRFLMHHSPAVFLIIYILLLSQMLMVSSPSERIQWSQNLPFIFSGPISQTVRAPTVIYIYTHITHVNININMLTIFLTMTLTNHLLYHPLWLTNVSFLNGVSPVFHQLTISPGFLAGRRGLGALLHDFQSPFQTLESHGHGNRDRLIGGTNKS